MVSIWMPRGTPWSWKRWKAFISTRERSVYLSAIPIILKTFQLEVHGSSPQGRTRMNKIRVASTCTRGPRQGCLITKPKIMLCYHLTRRLTRNRSQRLSYPSTPPTPKPVPKRKRT